MGKQDDIAPLDFVSSQRLTTLVYSQRSRQSLLHPVTRSVVLTRRPQSRHSRRRTTLASR